MICNDVGVVKKFFHYRMNEHEKDEQSVMDIFCGSHILYDIGTISIPSSHYSLSSKSPQ